MSRIITTEEFIRRAKKAHKNKYCYNNSVYKGWDYKVVIECPVHGFFEQRAGDHLKGRGCQKCAQRSVGEVERMPLDRFIEHSSKIHKNKYDYCKMIYNNRTKIIIICPKHGDFFVTPENHLKGYGCQKCQKQIIYDKYRIKFLQKVIKIHSNFYDYSEVKVIGHKKKVKIICTKHGPFLQLMDCHLRGNGCPRCILKEETKLEVIVRDLFKDWKIERHKKFFSKEHKRYRYFDLFVNKEEKKFIIEYDGKQHFKPVRFSSKMTQDEADRKFEKQKITDKLDKFFCERRGIKLYKISYKENMTESVKNLLKIS